jgi:hypothetical protein
MNKRFKILLPLFLGIALCGCYDNSDCFTENSDIVIVEFQTDTADYAFRLNLNPLRDTATFQIDTIISGQLQMIYNRKQRLLHPDCGVETVYELDTATTPLSNDIRVIKKEVTRPLSVNVEVVL